MHQIIPQKRHQFFSYVIELVILVYLGYEVTRSHACRLLHVEAHEICHLHTKIADKRTIVVNHGIYCCGTGNDDIQKQ